MRIALPPARIDTHFNLQKQQVVFDEVADLNNDVLLPAACGYPPERFLEFAHSPAYAHKQLHSMVPNGFGDYDSRKVVHAYQSSLALYAAAKAAVTAPAGQRVAFAPASGFHHAGWNGGHGFCTFNGLMITIMALESEGLINNAVIIDGDGHYGDGTDDIIQQTDCERWVKHIPLDYATVGYRLTGDRQTRAAQLLSRHLGELDSLPRRPDLVLYQAGADSHKEDPYRCGYLDDYHWRARDVAVFQWCKQRDVPVVWCLAGGYNGRKTVSLHNDTFASALRVYEPGSTRLVFGQAPLSDTAELVSPQLSDPE